MGKAEAVRRGLQRAIESGAEIVGYFDADLSTPGSELIRMVGILRSEDGPRRCIRVTGGPLGSRIRRSPLRHYSGRVFATFASLALGVPFYDTQCGAKVFRVNENLVAAMQLPFRSAWSFDVLLCQRLFDGTREIAGIPTSSFLEMPLEEWTDVSGSKVSLHGSALALWDVLVMGVGPASRATRTRHRDFGLAEAIEGTGSLTVTVRRALCDGRNTAPTAARRGNRAGVRREPRHARGFWMKTWL